MFNDAFISILFLVIVMSIIAAFAFLREDKIISFICFGLAIWILSISFCAGSCYKFGQIDALTGKVKYELIIKSDSTRVWQKILMREGK